MASEKHEHIQDVKEKIRKKRNRFIRQDAHKKKRLSKSWRKPRGLHSKMRLEKKGYRKKVKTGYRSPRETRNKSKDGKIIVRVCSARDIASMDPAKNSVIVGKIGVRKKIELLKALKEKNFTILNIRDPEGFIKLAKEKFEKKAGKKAERAKEKKEKEKKMKAAYGKKESKGQEKELTEEEKRQKEKKEKDKILTKKV